MFEKLGKFGQQTTNWLYHQTAVPMYVYHSKNCKKKPAVVYENISPHHTFDRKTLWARLAAMGKNDTASFYWRHKEWCLQHVYSQVILIQIHLVMPREYRLNYNLLLNKLTILSYNHVDTPKA